MCSALLLAFELIERAKNEAAEPNHLTGEHKRPNTPAGDKGAQNGTEGSGPHTTTQNASD